MDGEKEWTTIGLTKEQYAKATKLRAYVEYLTGLRITFGDIVGMSFGLFAGLMAPAKILFDKLATGEINEEEVAKRIGLTWIEHFRELVKIRGTSKTDLDMLLDTALRTLKSFEKITESAKAQRDLNAS